MLLLTLSDAHIPDRSIDLPAKFKKLLSVPNKISQVVLLGNCTKSYQFLKFVNDISNNVVIVRGEFDNATISTAQNLKEEIPMTTIIKLGDFKIGCCNGYTLVPKSDPLSLLILARQLDVDIMLWGGTHSVEAYTLEGKFFINPGSCTGAYSTDWPIQFESGQSLHQLYGNSNNMLSGEVTIADSTSLAAETTDAITESVSNSTQIHSVDKGERGNGTTNGSEGPSTEEDKKPAETTEVNDNSENEDDEDDEVDEVDINGGCIPSFCLLDISGSTCILYIYTYVNDEVKVDKVVYKKE